MRFVIDAQISPVLVKLIVAQGHQAEHVQHLDMKEADDTVIWHYALKHNAIVITKDDDFAKRFHQSKTAPSIVWLRIGNTSRKALLDWFKPLLPRIVALIEEGERLVEVR
jgi:predicted nuclease of predicted toxin-antitoxin system